MVSFAKNNTNLTEDKSNQTFPTLYHIVYHKEKGNFQGDFQGDFQADFLDFVSIIEIFIIYLLKLQMYFTDTFLFWNFGLYLGLCLLSLRGGNFSYWTNG